MCASKGCGRRCPGEHVGRGCPYKILHLMEDRGGIRERPRRSGKTTELVSIANELAYAGRKVYFLGRTRDMLNVAGRMSLDSRVVTMSIHEMERRARGLSPGLVVADELFPEELGEVARVMPGSRVVAAYWTARERG